MIQLDPLAERILSRLLIDFKARSLSIDDLENEYEGPSIESVRTAMLQAGDETEVDFDLALADLEKSEFMKTGPMVPYENRPDSSLVFIGLFSKREYLFLTTEGYKAAQRNTTQRRRDIPATQSANERRLAAILAADVVGYSRLMGQNETRTLSQLRSHRRELIDPAVAEHHGRLVKTTGDGLLVEFASVVEAVECAVKIQRRIGQRNTQIPEGQKIVFRIGINVGDVIVENNDIFGDGVNIAARLEGVAEPGAICVSSVVRDQVEGKLDVGFIDGGEPPLKNIERRIHVYHIVPGQDRTILPKRRLGPLWDDDKSRFRSSGEVLGLTDDGRRVKLRNDPALWLKVGPIPDNPFHSYGPSIRTNIQGKNVLQLLPMRFYTGDSDFLLAPDGFGTSKIPPKGTAQTDTVSFIFETGTLWAIDTQVLSQFGTIPFIYADLITTFKNFTALLDRYLGVPLPLRWQIGMEQLQGRHILMPTPTGQWSQYGRECSVERIVKEGLYERGDGPYASLRPFFEEILARCGLDPVEHMKGYPNDV